MTRSIVLQGQQVPYILKRSKRSTIGLKVSSGQLEVAAPKTLSVKFLEQVLTEKQHWILQKLQETESVGWALQDGLGGFVAGRPVTFRYQEAAEVQLEDGVLWLPATHPHEALRAFLLKEGAKQVTPRVMDWASKIGVHPQKVRITRAQKRWGSMNAKGILALSVGTLLLEPELLDYVVVHELCHLHHLNHSNEYWDTVERFLPDFEDRHGRVKKQGGVLTGLF